MSDKHTGRKRQARGQEASGQEASGQEARGQKARGQDAHTQEAPRVRRAPSREQRTPLRPHELPTNAELKRMLDAMVLRLENWKTEVEANPNPRMVHVLKNIVAQIDALTELSEGKISYSYKSLSRQISILVDEVAKLNIAITDSLMEDDLIDEREEERINESLRRVFQAALQLIRLVQQAFVLRKLRHPD
jgi:hypothetical protein